jgi:hypothetical protein
MRHPLPISGRAVSAAPGGRLHPGYALGTVAALLLTVVALRLIPEPPHNMVARPLNLAIAWADLNLDLGATGQGAVRAVSVDPELHTLVGRQGARWLAASGTDAERLRWSAALAAREGSARSLLQAAVDEGACSPDPKVRRDALRLAAAWHLQPSRAGGRSC